MVDPVTTHRWAYRGLFLALSLAAIFAALLPIDVGPGGVPGSNLILALAFAWVLRQPAFVPALLVGLAVLAADLLLMRPPGLWAGLVVLGLEFLRSRAHLSREHPFLVEWGMVAVVMAAVTAGYLLILALFMVAQPGIGLSLMQLVVTILSYPVVVAVSRVLFGVRKVAPGDLDAMGRQI